MAPDCSEPPRAGAAERCRNAFHTGPGHVGAAFQKHHSPGNHQLDPKLPQGNYLFHPIFLTSHYLPHTFRHKIRRCASGTRPNFIGAYPRLRVYNCIGHKKCFVESRPWMADEWFFFLCMLVLLIYLGREVLPRFSRFQLWCQPKSTRTKNR